MRATLRAELFNVPNLLTLSRIFGIPFVMLCIWRGDPKDCVIAAWIYSFVTATDYVDGYLARRWNQVSVMGKFLDPLADKLIVMAMLVMLVELDRVPGWLVVIILGREMTINGLRAIASIEGLVIPSGSLGKKKTALQMTGVMCLVVHYPYRVYFFGLHDGMVDFNRLGLIVLVGSMVLSVMSAVLYIVHFFKALDEKRRAADEVKVQ